jgi:hypothetical protein
MTRHEAYEYWLMRYNKAKDYNDPHWEAEERAEHHRWLAAMEQAMEALKDTSVSVDGDAVKLRKGVKKFRTENYVIYDINYLLENLAREIFLLYQTGKDFSKPAFNIDNIRRMFVDYAPCEKCTNPYTWGHICVKCGACGRKFDKEGRLIVDE